METNDLFESLKAIIKKYEPSLQVVHDKADHYYLNLIPADKKAKPEFFAAVQVKKSYVAFHLMPVYYHPALLENISDDLRKHMQGKSCFNFKTSDKKLFTELKKLTAASYDQYKATGKL